MMHACGCVAEREREREGWVAYYGNGGVMNASEQVKLNLNCITCCFEYTSPICPSLMYYQVQPAELLHSPEFGRGGREALKYCLREMQNL